jgi:hypothetical protein
MYTQAMVSGSPILLNYPLTAVQDRRLSEMMQRFSGSAHPSTFIVSVSSIFTTVTGATRTSSKPPLMIGYLILILSVLQDET